MRPGFARVQLNLPRTTKGSLRINTQIGRLRFVGTALSPLLWRHGVDATASGRWAEVSYYGAMALA